MIFAVVESFLTFLKRVSDLVVLAQPDLLLLLGGDVLDPLLGGVLLHELADEARVPELRGNAQVLAAPHHGVRLAPFGGCGHAVFAEVLLFTARLGYESVCGVGLALCAEMIDGNLVGLGRGDCARERLSLNVEKMKK